MTEWNAAEYVRQSTLQETMAAEVLALLDLTGALRILDVGCGDGRITAQIAARVPAGSVTGVDPSRDMIGFAAAHFGAPAHPNLRFDVADARALPYRDAFDLVVSFNALHWIPDQDAALRSMRGVLAAPGRAQLRLVSAGPRKSLENVVEETRRSSIWSAWFRDFRDPYLRLTPEQYAATAERNGFTVLAVRAATKTWDFKTRPAFFGFCAVGLVEWTRRLPESDRPAFIGEVLDRYSAATAERAGEANVFRFYQMDATLARTP